MKTLSVIYIYIYFNLFFLFSQTYNVDWGQNKLEWNIEEYILGMQTRSAARPTERIRKFVGFKRSKFVLKMPMKCLDFFFFIISIPATVLQVVKQSQKAREITLWVYYEFFFLFHFCGIACANNWLFRLSRVATVAREEIRGDYIKKKRNGIRKWAVVHANQLSLGLGSGRGQ